MTASSEAPRDRPGYGHGREALLDAAIRVVGRGGLRNLTYRAVAAEAGVTHGLVAHHFGSRDALLEEALLYSLRLSVATSSLIPGTSRIDDLAQTLPETIEADPDLQAFQFECVLESRRRPELRPYVERLYDTYREATREGLHGLGFDDQALADLVFAALDGLAFQQTSFGDPERTRAGLAALHRLLAEHQSRG